MKKECKNINKSMDVKNEKSRYRTAVENAQEIEVINHVMIQTVTMQMTFHSIISGLERGDYIIPDFQRMYRWTEKQVEELAIRSY